MPDLLIIYCTETSQRLRYVFDWLFKEQLGISYRLIEDEAELKTINFFISYGKNFPNALSIPDAGLLWQKEIIRHEINTGNWNSTPVIYAAESYTLPFDLFSAIFFLLSRYEEYYDYTPDKHTRYPARESILYQNGWLQRPLLDEWIQQLRSLLQQKYHLPIPTPVYSFLPTYDIDIAWSYKNKGLKRNAGGFIRDALSGRFADITRRAKVVLKNEADPYNSFDWLDALHKLERLDPIYFILCGEKNTTYDKHILPTVPAMQALIRKLANNKIGIHPSYYSNILPQLLQEEKKQLESIISRPVTLSRQHYIKNILPATYRLLIAQDITDDYSMGYADTIGFRAGTGQSFYWYDLEKEIATDLRIHSFCFMDTAAKFGMGLTAADAFKQLYAMSDILKQTDSKLTTVFHNFSLGNSDEWGGYSFLYRPFVETVSV